MQFYIVIYFLIKLITLKIVIGMNGDSEKIAADILQYLNDQLWLGVAKSIISKKLALTAAKLEGFQFMASYMQSATENKQIQSALACDRDPKTIQMDNFAIGQMPKQDNKNKKQRKTSQSESINQVRSRKFTMESTFSKKSPDKQKNQSQQNIDSGLITLPQQEDPHYVKDPDQQKCRTYKFKTQKQTKDMKKLVQDRMKQRSQNSIKNKKMIKQLKKYTYDYDGKFFGIGMFDAGQQKMLKLEKQNGQQQLINRETKNPQQKQIINEKIKQRETRNDRSFLQDDKNQPKFDENRPQSLLDLFEQEGKLSEGIKLIGQKGKEKMTKQNPRRKLSGLKQYRKNQYQEMVKDKKFKDFKKLSLNTSAPIINIDNVMSNEDESQEMNFKKSNSNNSNIAINLRKNEQLNSILPPIKSSYIKKSNKLGFNKLYGGYSQSSRSILNQSGFTSKKSQKSLIKIDHQELYSEIIFNPYQAQ